MGEFGDSGTGGSVDMGTYFVKENTYWKITSFYPVVFLFCGAICVKGITSGADTVLDCYPYDCGGKHSVFRVRYFDFVPLFS